MTDTNSAYRGHSSAPGGSLRVAMLAPPWNTVPPHAAGGTQANIARLSDELVRRHHHVTIYCAPGSRSAAVVHPVLDGPYPQFLGRSRFEADYVARAFAAIESAEVPFDLIHDHSGYVALAMADRIAVPMVHTMHWHLGGHYADFFGHHGDKASLVVLSRGQLDCAANRCRRAEPASGPSVELAASVIPNCLVLANWPFLAEKEDYLLWIGRICEEKGPHRAIEAARRAGRRMVLAGPVLPGHERFFETQVRPELDNRLITYVGEVTRDEAARLFLRAAGLLMPIRWCEPFGNVMVEAMACGTPVIAFPEGAAPEIVDDGRNGFLVDDTEQMARAAASLGSINPHECRATVAERYDVARVTTLYEAVYRDVVSSRSPV